MKKVLIVFNHPAPYKVRLFNELSKHFELHVIFERSKNSDRSKSFYFEEKYDFIEHKIKGFPLGKENFLSNQIVSHLKHNKYDLIIMNGYSQLAEIKAIKFLQRKEIPYVLYINGGIIKNKESHLKKHIKSKLISKATWYFSPDLESNKYLIYYGASNEKILNYPYSTIYEKEILNKTIDKVALRKKAGVPFDKVFVSSGQLIKRKNYFELVKEWKSYPENYGLYLFGSGEEKEKISRFIEENHMKNVILKGFSPRQETLEFFKLSDVFLFPSNEDIYGHVINEALSQGLPVVSSKHVNSAIKLIKNKENGFLLNSFGGESLKSAIEYCLENDMHEKCLEIARQNTLEIMSKEHIRLINEVLEK